MTASTSVDVVRASTKAGTALEFLAYFVCSAIALSTDYVLLAAGLQWGMDYRGAAAAGFLGGLLVAYWLSVRFVFKTRTVVDPRTEFMIFSAIGLMGLTLTELLMWLLVSGAGLPAVQAKLPTAGFVFLFNFGARKALLFTRRPSASRA